jgi:hypothetical protein
MRSKLCSLLAMATLAMPGFAQQWFSLSGRDTGPAATQVEVDLQTVLLREGSGEAVLRVTYEVLQPHPAGFGYRSFIATANIDCLRRTVGLASAAYFALPGAQGMRVGTDSSGRDRGMPSPIADSVPAPAKQALLRAACPAGAS